jgi:hypothetical protein
MGLLQERPGWICRFMRADIISNSGRKTFGALAVLAVGLALFCFWLVFSYTDAGHRAEVRINSVIPGWLIIGNFLVLPCVTAIAAGPLGVRLDLRSVLLMMMLFSGLILEVTFRRYLLESWGVLAVVALEVYWVIPKWGARHRRVS